MPRRKFAPCANDGYRIQAQFVGLDKTKTKGHAACVAFSFEA